MAYNISAMEPRIQYDQTKDGVSIANREMNGERVLRVDLHTHTHYSPDSILSPRR